MSRVGVVVVNVGVVVVAACWLVLVNVGCCRFVLGCCWCCSSCRTSVLHVVLASIHTELFFFFKGNGIRWSLFLLFKSTIYSP